MFFARVKKSEQVDPREKRERQRAFLGCYYLTSMYVQSESDDSPLIITQGLCSHAKTEPTQAQFRYDWLGARVERPGRIRHR